MVAVSASNCRTGRMAVDRQIAEVFDDPRLVEDRIAHGLPERRFVNQGTQVVLIRQAQSAVVLVEPRHGEFQVRRA